jgi:hypothetical protein
VELYRTPTVLLRRVQWQIDIILFFFTPIYKLSPLLLFIRLTVTCLRIADPSERAV